MLRCKTPEMVRKEMGVHLPAYNLLRSVMCAAAVPTATNPEKRKRAAKPYPALKRPRNEERQLCL
ncbi:MAG: hypothetical protein WD065_02430 [Planctomycetaceae bacterium]